MTGRAAAPRHSALGLGPSWAAVSLLLLAGPAPGQGREHSGGGIFDRGIADILWEHTQPERFLAFRWRNPFLYKEDLFNVTLVTTPCPPPAVPPAVVTHVVCGEVWTAHWPHFAEVLFPCWSFFRQHPDAEWHLLRFAHVTRNVEGLQDRLRLLRVRYVDHLPAVRCSRVRVVTRTHSRDGFRGTEGPLGFLAPTDAAALRAALLNASGPPPVTPAAERGRLRIGILNRRGSRRLLRTALLRQYLEAQAPAGVVEEVDDINRWPFAEQCRWVHRQAVLIAPHGAQLTNLVCARPCASLLEIFPRRYFLPGFYQPLAVLMGMQAFGAYFGSDPYGDSEWCMWSYFCRTWALRRSVPLHPSIRGLLPLLLQSHHQCRAAYPDPPDD